MKAKFLTILVLFSAQLHAQTLRKGSTGLIHPAGFWENKGQIRNQLGEERTDINYHFTAPALQVFLQNGGWSYQLHLVKEKLTVEKFLRTKNELLKPGEEHLYRLDIEWHNANKNGIWEELDKNADYNNYYLGADSFLQVYRFNQLTYSGLYPGVDLHFKTRTKGNFEYDIVCAAGANLEQICFSIEGADSIVVRDENLYCYTPLGILTENIPESWQITPEGKVSLKVKWKIHEGRIGFELPANYNPAYPLVIDPWATYYGGGQDYGEDIAADAANNSYTVGFTGSSTLIATSGTFQTTLNATSNTYDAFMVRMSATGVRSWGTYFGGSEAESNSRVDFRSGNLVWTFATSSTSLATSGTFKTTLPGSPSAVLSRFNPTNGQRIWSTYFGGSISEFPTAVALDNNGNIYLSGVAYSSSGVATTGAFRTTLAGPYDSFIARFNNNGTIAWSTYFGGAQEDYINDMAVDNLNQIVIAGYSNSTGIATTGVHQTVFRGGGFDGFIAKFAPTGGRTWCTFYGGTAQDIIQTVACDLSQRIFVGGKSFSTTFIATPGAFRTTIPLGASGSGLLARFSSSGTLDYGTYYGGNLDDYIYGIKTDVAGNIYFCGFTNSNTGIATPGSHKPTLSGSSGEWDAMVGKFSGSGTRLWCTYYGGEFQDLAFALAVDAASNVIVTGYTTSNNGITTPGSLQTTFPGGAGYTTFIAHFNTNGVLPVTWLHVGAKPAGKEVVVEWSTSTETNNDYFTVEHSTNGTTFTELGTVNGAGTSSIVNSYQFLHNEPVPGTQFYRIRQTDFNGTFDFSDIIVVNLNTTNKKLSGYVSSGNFILKAIDPDDAWQWVSLINNAGQDVTPSGAGLVTNISHLPQGVYTAVLLLNGEPRTLRFIK